MRSFQNLAIAKKLMGIITLAASIALLLAGTAFVIYELNTYRDSATNDLNTIAHMIAGTSTAALAFGDQTAAGETLNTLRGESHIVAACIYRRNGMPLARYVRDGNPAHIPAVPLTEGPKFEGGHLTLVRAVILDGEQVGTVFLKSDLREMYARLMRYGYIVIAVLVVSLFAAGFVSWFLQRLISKPILDLAETASRVSKDNNYALRVEKRANDEIRVLVDRFNGMMEQVHARDEALQAARDELEDRVVERTGQLQAEIGERKNIEKALIAAKESAEASSKAKSVFLANMSHELRTPLNAIIGYSEMLEEDAEELGQSGFIADLRKINGAGKHLLSLINDVLDLSKIEAGRMELHLEKFTVGQLLDEVASTAEPLARKNGNHLLVKCDDTKATMQADVLKFRQSLLNLLSNACKFTEKGTVTLAVNQHARDGQHWFDWVVQDTGIGIAPEHMHKLFASFSQVDSSTTRKIGGTGLGLAISKRLCEMMGGQILVESEAGIGSKFTIRLPADLAEATPEAAPAPVSTPVETPPSTVNNNSKVILIIDDDPAVQHLLARSLGKYDFHVVSASNGAEGIRKARVLSPSAIILDIMLPDVDGWTVFRQLKADPALAGTPVLIHSITENHPQGLSLEGTTILQKPVPVERLVAVLKQHSSPETARPPAKTELSNTLEAECPGLHNPIAGFSALAKIAEVSGDHIALDVKMTGDSGHHMIEQLARSQSWQRVSILRVPLADGSGDQWTCLAKAMADNEPAPEDLVFSMNQVPSNQRGCDG